MSRKRKTFKLTIRCPIQQRTVQTYTWHHARRTLKTEPLKTEHHRPRDGRRVGVETTLYGRYDEFYFFYHAKTAAARSTRRDIRELTRTYA